MNDDQQLKLQSYLDGELSVREARQMEAWLAQDKEAQELFAELKHTKTALIGNEPELKLPESREFFWSKIEREIRLREQQPEKNTIEIPLFAWLQRYLLPVGAAAAVAVMATVMINKNRLPLDTAAVMETEALNEEMNSISFRSEADRMTVIYLYDRDQEIASDMDAEEPFFQ